MYIVEKGLSDAGTRHYMGRKVSYSLEEINSDDIDNASSRTATSSTDNLRYPPNSPDGDRNVVTDNSQSLLLPKGTRPKENIVGIAHRSWAQLPSINNCARSDMEKEKEQELAAHFFAEITPKIGEDCVSEVPMQKAQGSRGTLRVAEERSGHPQKEIVVATAQVQKRVDHETPNGPQMALKLSLQTQTNEFVPTNELGLIQHTTGSPTPNKATNVPIMPSKVARDCAAAEARPTTKVGLSNHTTANNPQHNNAAHSYQTSDGGREWKVFARKKGCKQNMAQQSENQLKLGDANMTTHQDPTSAAMKSTTTGYPSYPSSMERGTSEQTTENNPKLLPKSKGPNEG